MALLSPSSSSRRVSHRRKTSVLTIFLLVLSHNVWNTLQCVTSSSQPKNRPMINLPPEDDDGSSYENGQVSNNEYTEGVGEGEVMGGNRDFEKKDGEDKEQQHRNMCNHRLLDAVSRVCGINNFYIPDNSPEPSARTSLNEILAIAGKRSAGEVIQRRLTRSLANECCKKPCTESTMRKFCRDRNRIPKEPTQEPEIQLVLPKTEQELGETPVVQQPESRTQLTPSSQEEPEPAIYYPLFHFIKFMHRQFGNKNSDLRPVMIMDGEDDTNVQVDNQQMGSAILGDERDLPLPQARVQHAHSHSHTHSSQQPQQVQLPNVHSNNYPNYRPREYQRYEGNPFQAPGDENRDSNVGRGNGVSFTNTASHHKGQHAGQHRHRPTATNTGRGDGASASANEIVNQILVPMKNYLHRHQGQQPPRKSSSNVLTSTIAPDVTIIRLESLTDDEAPYVKRK